MVLPNFIKPRNRKEGDTKSRLPHYLVTDSGKCVKRSKFPESTVLFQPGDFIVDENSTAAELMVAVLQGKARSE